MQVAGHPKNRNILSSLIGKNGTGLKYVFYKFTLKSKSKYFTIGVIHKPRGKQSENFYLISVSEQDNQ